MSEITKATADLTTTIEEAGIAGAAEIAAAAIADAVADLGADATADDLYEHAYPIAAAAIES